jgi:uncharacterized protein (TIGR01777 family)
MSTPSLRVVVTGGTGFLGKPLVARLAGDGHRVTILTRNPTRVPASIARAVAWTPDGSAATPWADEINGVDAVINLAGESIGNRRWLAAQKRRIRDSRVFATRSVVQAIERAAERPPLLINGSAAGYYGPRGDEFITEDTPPGTDFLAKVCVEWEAEAMRAAGSRTRVVFVRTGIVLGPGGGVLKRLLPPFWLGAGGPMGSGRQYFPWIHLEDWVGLVRFLMGAPSATGPFNATAPNPVTNREFARALGRAMKRPAFIPTPGFALKLLLGEMAEPLVLTGQRMIPANAERLGYTFAYPHLQEALRDILEKRP